jgi:hypothetical protein
VRVSHTAPHTFQSVCDSLPRKSLKPNEKSLIKVRLGVSQNRLTVNAGHPWTVEEAPYIA